MVLRFVSERLVYGARKDKNITPVPLTSSGAFVSLCMGLSLCSSVHFSA